MVSPPSRTFSAPPRLRIRSSHRKVLPAETPATRHDSATSMAPRCVRVVAPKHPLQKERIGSSPPNLQKTCQFSHPKLHSPWLAAHAFGGPFAPRDVIQRCHPRTRPDAPQLGGRQQTSKTQRGATHGQRPKWEWKMGVPGREVAGFSSGGTCFMRLCEELVKLLGGLSCPNVFFRTRSHTRSMPPLQKT